MFLYRLLADLILLIHLAYVAFVVVGMLLICVGIARRWAWVRNFWFRAAHFFMIALVAAESVIGLVCPLTRWENELRVAGGEEGQPGSLIGRAVHAVIFFNAPEWVFTMCYILFALAVLTTLFLAPPRRPWQTAKQ